MNWKSEYKSLLWIISIFLIIYFLPLDKYEFISSIQSALFLLKWYAREHVILCLIPAIFIAGAISVFISQTAIIKYFGVKAKKWIAYLVASVSGSILAVCSCTILPLFAGIYKRGAGIGPATTFLYAGPAINILAIILTARILGFELGLARVVGSVFFSVIIGLIMQRLFRKEEADRLEVQLSLPNEQKAHSVNQTISHFAIMIAILVVVTLAKPEQDSGFWYFVYGNKWIITSVLAILFMVNLVYILKIKVKYVIIMAIPVILSIYFLPGYQVIVFSIGIISLSILLSWQGEEAGQWLSTTWDLGKQILPLLAAGVLIAGFLLGAPHGHDGLIPRNWVAGVVGGNSLFANFFASVVGAFMYFATLTEVPILEGLIQNGMGKGPALALLLAGPALSLPNMLVIRSVIGIKMTSVFVTLVVVMATISGYIFGSLF
jgi:uncharacterized membrane protein YraQ (UPF0718 family)